MIDDLIKLIDLSIEDGQIAEKDLEIIKSKAQKEGLSEEELNLIIRRRIKKTDEEIQSNSSQRKADSSDGTSRNVFPYIIALLALGSTFFNWVEVYARTDVSSYGESYNSAFDASLNAWQTTGWAGTIIIIFGIGCLLYYKNFKYFWVAGLIALLDGFLIAQGVFTSEINANVDLGQFGSSLSESGLNLLVGYYLYMICAGLFTISGLTFRLSFIGAAISEIRTDLIDIASLEEDRWGKIALFCSLGTPIILVPYIQVGSYQHFGEILSVLLLIEIVQLVTWYVVFRYSNKRYKVSSIRHLVVMFCLSLILGFINNDFVGYMIVMLCFPLVNTAVNYRRKIKKKISKLGA